MFCEVTATLNFDPQLTVESKSEEIPSRCSEMEDKENKLYL